MASKSGRSRVFDAAADTTKQMASTSTEPQPAPLLSVRETARRLAVSVDTIYRLRAAGKLPAVRLHPSGPLRFEPEVVDALISRGREAA